MKYRLWSLMFTLTIGSFSQFLIAQDMTVWEDSLLAISDRLMLSEELLQREKAFQEIIPTLQSALHEEGSFAYPFENLVRTSVILAPDTTFRIFTGQLFVSEDQYRYYGLIQFRDATIPPVVLKDTEIDAQDLPWETFDHESWPGAVYYGITQHEVNDKSYYTVFGYNGYRMFESRKIADVIHFDDQGVHFGAPLFYRPAKDRFASRLLIQYSADVSIRLNFDKQMDMIVFDHLIPMTSPYKERSVAMVPDGSYCGYRLNDEGLWIYIDKIFHQTVVSPPREKAVLDQNRDLDILGNPRSGKRGNN